MIGRGFVGPIVGSIMVALVVTGCSLLAGPVVRIDNGIAPRMAPDQVSTLTIEHIHGMELTAGHIAKPARILSITTTTTTAAGVAQLEPDSGRGQPPAPGIQWLVRAEGTFTNNRTPPGAEPMLSTNGYFVISDIDGSVPIFASP